MSTLIETKATNVFYLGELARTYASATSYVEAVRKSAERVQQEAINLRETLNTSEASTTKEPAIEAAEAAAEAASSYLSRETIDNPNYLAGNARRINDARARMIEAARSHSDHLKLVKTLKRDAMMLPEIAQNAQETADRHAEKHTQAKEAFLSEAVDGLDDDEERALKCLRSASAHHDEALRLSRQANTWGIDHAQSVASNLACLDAESITPERADAIRKDIDGFKYAPILREFEYAEEYLLNFLVAAIDYVDEIDARETVADTLARHNVTLPGILTSDELAGLLPIWPHVESVTEAQNVLTALAHDLAKTAIDYVEEMNPCGEFERALEELQEITPDTLPSRRKTYCVTLSIELNLTPGEADSLDGQDLLRDYHLQIKHADVDVQLADY